MAHKSEVMTRQVCPECGARLADGAERCDLCGAPQESEAAPGSRSPDADMVSEDRDDIPVPPSEPVERLCSACGWKNPPGARFCSDCGARLKDESRLRVEVGRGRSADRPTNGPPVDSSGRPGTRSATSSAPGPPRRTPPVSPSSPPPTATPPAPSSRDEGGRRGSYKGDAALTRQVFILVGLALMVVVALYMVTVISKQRPSEQDDDRVAVPVEARSARLIREVEAVPITTPYRERADSIQAAIASADAGDALEFTRQFIDLLHDIGRVDRAAIEQMRLAQTTDSPSEWKSAGRLFIDWMERSDPETRPEIAVLAIDAFHRVLEKNPDDLEARADLGWAYQYDPQKPMEAIRQTNLVLEADADHLAANYNKGVFLMRINRLEQAHEQFEKVQEIAGVDSPFHQQAQMWIDAIQEARGEQRVR